MSEPAEHALRGWPSRNEVPHRCRARAQPARRRRPCRRLGALQNDARL